MDCKLTEPNVVIHFGYKNEIKIDDGGNDKTCNNKKKRRRECI